jgi:Peptidase M50B-like
MHAPLPGVPALPPVTPAPLPGPEAALVGLAALAIIAIPFLWALVDHIDTMAHEGMHALFAALLGFSVLEFVLNRDGSGHVIHDAERFGLRVLLVSLVGYLGPSLFGLGAARLIETGHVIAVLWVAILLLVLLLTLVSPSFGFVSVPVAVVLLVLVMRYQRTGLEEFTVYLVTWLLLLSGVRNAVGHGAGAGDAKNLSARTHLPRHLWALIWMAGTVLAVIIGGKWLVLGS